MERYAAASRPRPDGAVIKSRHILHPDNGVAVTALVEDLERIGAGRFAVRRHRFTHEGRPLENVEAELRWRARRRRAGHGAHGLHRGPAARVPAALGPGSGGRRRRQRDRRGARRGGGDWRAGRRLGPPRRTVRFVLFNAEEHGLVGSRAYARDQAALGTPIVAVFQMDMIGYDVLPERTFELHAGFTPSRAVQERSLALAQMIAELVPQVSPDSARAADLSRRRRARPCRTPQRPLQLPAAGLHRLPGIGGPVRRAREATRRQRR